MRFVIFLGLIFIAAAIEQPQTYSSDVVSFIVIILMISGAMDILEFFKNINKK